MSSEEIRAGYYLDVTKSLNEQYWDEVCGMGLRDAIANAPPGIGVDMSKHDLLVAPKGSTVQVWHRIETAPKDGSRLLVASGDIVYAVRWRIDEWVDPAGYVVNGATHWMPLPKPPGTI